MKIEFSVYGNAVPQQRARVFVDKHTGRIRAANPRKCTDWRDSIRMQAIAHRPPQLLDGALALVASFFMLKPPSKPKKVKHPKWKPDYDNLLKAVTDALEGIVYTNDSRICAACVTKNYGDPPRVEIIIEELEGA